MGKPGALELLLILFAILLAVRGEQVARAGPGHPVEALPS